MERKEAVSAELRALIAQQATQLTAQAAHLAELELALAKAHKNSATSSKPPASDLTNPPPKHPRPGRRSQPHHGAQPGHARHLRVPLAPERVDDTQDYAIEEADLRRLHLPPTGPYESRQHIELPEAPVWVTEHRLAVYRSAAGDRYLPDVPELKGPLFGPPLVDHDRVAEVRGPLELLGH